MNQTTSNIGKVGKVERFQETFALTRRIQGAFHWTHIRIHSIEPGSENAPFSAEKSQKREEKHSQAAMRNVGEALLAVVASKKNVDRRAVGRNRAKRRIRPIMIKLTHEWLGSLGTNGAAPESRRGDLRLHWIVRPKNSALTATAKELESDVRRAFEDYIKSWNGGRESPVRKR